MRWPCRDDGGALKIPWHFTFAWAASAAAGAATCAIILRQRLLTRWPFLFLWCGEIWVSFLLLESASSYATYFQTFWFSVVGLYVIRIGLAWDVLRSIPGVHYFPVAARRSTVVVALVAAGSVCWLMMSGPGLPDTWASVKLVLTRGVLAAWAAVVLVLVANVVITGFGFTETGLRVLTGAIILQASGTVLGFLYGDPHRYHLAFIYNEADTALASVVSAYWGYAMLSARRSDERRRAEAENFISQEEIGR